MRYKKMIYQMNNILELYEEQQEVITTLLKRNKELLYEVKQYRALTEEEETVVRTGAKYKENPEYDASQQYIERVKRKEWSAIGMIGVLSVYDDGTCQENGYCIVSDGGIATACEDSNVKAYRVLERVTDNIVKVLFK